MIGSSATDADRVSDIIFVIEQVTRFAWFFMNVKDLPVKKFKQDSTFLHNFYGTSHKQIVRILNAANVSVFSIAFYLHVMLSHFRVYGDPKVGEPRVIVESTRDFDGGRALEETVLWLLLAGQDCNASNYTYTVGNTENGKSGAVYNGDSCAECIIQVPGIGISQTDPRNQEALMFCHSILHDLPDGALPVHSRESIFKGGKYSPLLKPSNFLKRPLKWGGWPVPNKRPSPLVSIVNSESEDSEGNNEDDGEDDEGEVEEQQLD